MLISPCDSAQSGSPAAAHSEESILTCILLIEKRTFIYYFVTVCLADTRIAKAKRKYHGSRKMASKSGIDEVKHMPSVKEDREIADAAGDTSGGSKAAGELVVQTTIAELC